MKDIANNDIYAGDFVKILYSDWPNLVGIVVKVVRSDAPDKIKVLIIIFLVFIPTYFAVLILSPTTITSKPCFVFVI